MRVGRRRQRPGGAGGAPATAAASVNPPGRSQHCAAASAARPRTAAPLLPLAASRPSAPPRGAPALTIWRVGLAALPGPDGRAGCPEEAGRGRAGRAGPAGQPADDDAELLRGPQLHAEEHAVRPGLLQVPAGSSQMPEVGGEL